MYRNTSGSATSTHWTGEKPRKSDDPMSPRSLPWSEIPTHSYGMPIGARKCMIDSAISLHESREPPVQLALLDRRFAHVAATFASVRGHHAFNRGGLRPDRLAVLAEGLERNPSRRVGMTRPVAVHQRPDFLGAGGEVSHQAVQLRLPIRLRRRDDPDSGSEPIEHATEVLPIVVDPVAVASERIGHIDEPATDELLPVFLRELADLPVLALPLVLRVEDEALDRPSMVLLKTARQQMGKRDLAAEPADVLQPADAQARIHDDVRLLADVGLRLREKLIVPVRQSVSPRLGTG